MPEVRGATGANAYDADGLRPEIDEAVKLQVLAEVISVGGTTDTGTEPVYPPLKPRSGQRAVTVPFDR